MAIDHESPFKELNLKNRRIMVTFSISKCLNLFPPRQRARLSVFFFFFLFFRLQLWLANSDTRGFETGRRRAGGRQPVASVVAAAAGDALLRPVQSPLVFP